MMIIIMEKSNKVIYNDYVNNIKVRYKDDIELD